MWSYYFVNKNCFKVQICFGYYYIKLNFLRISPDDNYHSMRSVSLLPGRFSSSLPLLIPPQTKLQHSQQQCGWGRNRTPSVHGNRPVISPRGDAQLPSTEIQIRAWYHYYNCRWGAVPPTCARHLNYFILLEHLVSLSGDWMIVVVIR